MARSSSAVALKSMVEVVRHTVTQLKAGVQDLKDKLYGIKCPDCGNYLRAVSETVNTNGKKVKVSKFICVNDRCRWTFEQEERGDIE